MWSFAKISSYLLLETHLATVFLRKPHDIIRHYGFPYNKLRFIILCTGKFILRGMDWLKPLHNIVIVIYYLFLDHFLVVLLLLDIVIKTLLFVRSLIIFLKHLGLLLFQAHDVVNKILVVNVDVVEQNFSVKVGWNFSRSQRVKSTSTVTCRLNTSVPCSSEGVYAIIIVQQWLDVRDQTLLNFLRVFVATSTFILEFVLGFLSLQLRTLLFLHLVPVAFIVRALRGKLDIAWVLEV